jgi:phospholipid/cholesterol/gamma-HCH transport system substrate-binding protein
MARPVVNKAFAVGLLTAVCGVAFLIAFTFFRKGGYSERDSYLVHAYYEDATGLTWKSRVQIAGIQVGEVDRIALEGSRARLDLRIKKDIDVRADACVVKRFPSTLLPDALLDLAPGTAKAPSLRDLPEEQRELKCVLEGTSIAKLLDSMANIATDVQGVTKELQGMVAGSQGSIKQIIANLERVSARINEGVESGQGKVSAILDNTQAFTGTLAEVAQADRDRYRAIAKNIEQASARLDQVLQSVQQLMGGANEKDGELRKSVTDARQTLARLNHTLENVDKITTDIGQGKGVAGKILADERLGNKLGGAIEGVSDYVDRLVKLKLEVQLRSEWLLNQTGSKTYAGLRIIPRPDKYYIFQIVNDPRGLTTQTVETDAVKDPSGNIITTSTTRTIQQQQLSFTLLFAKRYGPAAFRIGLIESSGGAGADLFLLDDALKLSVDVYQFARPQTDVFPRAKLWVDYRFLHYFYVTTGADDFLNRWRSSRFPGGAQFNIGNDVFFGGGLMFTDDDLKALIGAVGSSISGVSTTGQR